MAAPTAGTGITKAKGSAIWDSTGDHLEPINWTQAPLAIRDGALEQFRKALGRAEGKSRLTIVRALASLQDKGSTEALKEVARDEEREVRLAAL